MLDEDAEHPFEMAAVENQQPVETLHSDGADEALGSRVRLCGYPPSLTRLHQRIGLHEAADSAAVARRTS
jgi:hypothetical protein